MSSELYDTLLHGAPDGTVVCEMGYNVGASAVTFLHGMRNQPNSRLHSFDKSFPGNSAEFLNALRMRTVWQTVFVSTNSSPVEQNLHVTEGILRLLYS